ncbi:right-handed parallel beta-helix repeat-containing protein [Parapedobacter tibetensis]|uniref:right-handed parallel beta-helix repeat-containing protein n=1 Tax=Parapedobacter tibetensis TaxID=2972951 RepID=UPI00214D3CB0|nr:right-handed parallel beta-helix repeat-containing protein [Parapedobacter tibetensis]
MKTRTKNNHWTKSVTLAVTTVLLLTMPCFAVDYFVDPVSGNDSNAGTSTGNAWKNLDNVIATKSFASGDVIYLMDGDHGVVTLKKRNTGYVQVKKYASHSPRIRTLKVRGGAYWTFDGIDFHAGTPPANPANNQLVHPVSPVYASSLIQITKNYDDDSVPSYLTFTHCNVYSAANTASWAIADWRENVWNGVVIYNYAERITFDSCHVYNVNFAFAANGGFNEPGVRHIVVRNSTIENFSADGLQIFCSNAHIERNIIRNAYIISGNHYDMIQGTATNTVNGETVSTSVTLRRNLLIDATADRIANDMTPQGKVQGIGCFDGWFVNWRIDNNIVANNNPHGISLLGGKDSYVVNNTVVRNPHTYGATNEQPFILLEPYKSNANFPSTNNYVVNNIAEVIKNWSKDPDSTNTFSNNYAPAAGGPFPYTQTFVNYAAYNFRLAPTAGWVYEQGMMDSHIHNKDYDGVTRTIPYDIGAFETSSGNSLGAVTIHSANMRNGRLDVSWKVNDVRVRVLRYEVELSKQDGDFEKVGELRPDQGGRLSERFDLSIPIGGGAMLVSAIVLLPLVFRRRDHRKNNRKVGFILLLSGVLLSLTIWSCEKRTEGWDEGAMEVRIVSFYDDNTKDYSAPVSVRP